VQVNPTEVEFRDRRLLHFGGSDYFRLSWNARVRRAVTDAARTFGHNVGSSRMTTGNHPLYAQLESALQRALGFPSAILTASGYGAPLVAGQALAGRVSHVFVDEKSHGSLRDAAVFTGATVRFFPHDDPAALRRALGRVRRRARIAVFSDGMSAHEGTISPLVEYLNVLPADGTLLVDDAHGFGTVGRRGRGSLELLSIRDPRVLLAVTLSKALGAYGGAVLGPRWLRDQVVRQSRIYASSTPLPPPLVAAALAALEVLAEEGLALRERLRQNMCLVREALAVTGPELVARPGPMFTAAPTTRERQERLRRSLLRAGIYPPFIRYAGGPADRFFRFAVSTAHQPEHLARLRGVLARDLD
jgi:8-amino-7-oxononanoate synthase